MLVGLTIECYWRVSIVESNHSMRGCKGAITHKIYYKNRNDSTKISFMRSEDDRQHPYNSKSRLSYNFLR